MISGLQPKPTTNTIGLKPEIVIWPFEPLGEPSGNSFKNSPPYEEGVAPASGDGVVSSYFYLLISVF